MRNITLILLSALTLITAISCNKANGTGEVLSETRDVADFTKIRSDISGDVIINQGFGFNVTVEAEESLLPLIETIVSDNRLTVRYKQHIVLKPNQYIKVRVTLPLLDEIAQKGTGKIDIDEFIIEEVDLNIDISGSGNVNFNRLVARVVTTNINGSGNVTINSGHIATSNIQVNGSGNINQLETHSDNADINIEGSGTVKLSVEKYLSVNIKGSGDVYYSGNPKIDAWVTGSGRLKKI